MSGWEDARWADGGRGWAAEHGWDDRGWGGPEPRWTPDRPLALRITRVGRFRRIDPSRPGDLWSWSRWVALAGYLALAGGAFAVAWRRTGGPREAAAAGGPPPSGPSRTA